MQDELTALVGKPVVVEAVVPPPKDKMHVMQVKTFKRAA